MFPICGGLWLARAPSVGLQRNERVNEKNLLGLLGTAQSEFVATGCCTRHEIGKPNALRKSTRPRLTVRGTRARGVDIPEGVDSAEITPDGDAVALTNLRKPFWPELNLCKRSYSITPMLHPSCCRTFSTVLW